MRSLRIAVSAFAALACAGCPCRRGEPAPAAPPPVSVPAPEAAPAPGTPDEAAREALVAEGVRAMRAELGEGFTVQGRWPFVVGGDPSLAQLDALMEHTVFAPYDAFYRQFFKVRPDALVRVYLFSGDASYRANARRLFGDEQDTPFGYYKPARRALVMNISRGGGTLIHEMVHALMDFDFPRAPTWFNEGMGSLFEQSSTRYHRIMGLENWRLERLKKGIAEDELTPLRALMNSTRMEFLGPRLGLHYAEARYFCMYMQQEGILEEFYRTFRDRFDEDPSGVAFAEALFDRPLEEVERDWIPWVRGLTFEGR